MGILGVTLEVYSPVCRVSTGVVFLDGRGSEKLPSFFFFVCSFSIGIFCFFGSRLSHLRFALTGIGWSFDAV